MNLSFQCWIASLRSRKRWTKNKQKKVSMKDSVDDLTFQWQGQLSPHRDSKVIRNFSVDFPAPPGTKALSETFCLRNLILAKTFLASDAQETSAKIDDSLPCLTMSTKPSRLCWNCSVPSLNHSDCPTWDCLVQPSRLVAAAVLSWSPETRRTIGCGACCFSPSFTAFLRNFILVCFMRNKTTKIENSLTMFFLFKLSWLLTPLIHHLL